MPSQGQIPERNLQKLLRAKLPDCLAFDGPSETLAETSKYLESEIATSGSVFAESSDRQPRGTEKVDQEKPYKKLGHFIVNEKIGVGGMGVVYSGLDENLNRPVAIKVLNARLACDESAARRFVREAQAMAAIHHLNVATIYHVGRNQADNAPFLAMELLQGGKTLKSYLASENLMSIEQAINTIHQIAHGLKSAHSKGLVHRDIKPDNIWITDSGQVKILDFGLACAVVNEDTKLTQAGQVVGSPAYMSPEQTRNEPIDHRSDLFSLGAVFFELLTGTSPFARDSITATLLAVVSETPRFEMASEEVPNRIQSLVYSLLEKHPDNRLQSTEELICQLNKLLESGTTDPPETASMVAVAPQTSRRSANHETNDTTDTVVSKPGRYLKDVDFDAQPLSKTFGVIKFVRRNRGLVATIIAVIVLVIIGVFAFPWSNGGGDGDPNFAKNGKKLLPIAEFIHRDIGENGSSGLLFYNGPVHYDDTLQINIQFDQPVYCFLFAVNPDGVVQLCYPEKEELIQKSPIRKLRYPGNNDRGRPSGLSIY